MQLSRHSICQRWVLPVDWQVLLSEMAEQYTAFAILHGLFKFRVMPFGFVNASGCFSRLIQIVLLGIERVSCYMDRIFICAPN